MYNVVCTHNMVCTMLAASLQLPCHVLIVSFNYQAACLSQKHILGLCALIEAMCLAETTTTAANGMASIQVSTEIEIDIGTDSTYQPLCAVHRQTSAHWQELLKQHVPATKQMNLKVDESVIHEELNLAWAGETDAIASASLHAKASAKMLLLKSAVVRSPELCDASGSTAKAAAFCSVAIVQSVNVACDSSQQDVSNDACNTFSVKLLFCNYMLHFWLHGITAAEGSGCCSAHCGQNISC